MKAKNDGRSEATNIHALLVNVIVGREERSPTLEEQCEKQPRSHSTQHIPQRLRWHTPLPKVSKGLKSAEPAIQCC